MNVKTISERLKALALKQAPGQLVIQLTDKCNATCPQCGMRVSSGFKRTTLDKDEVLKIIDTAADNRIKALSITGGEPLLMVNDLCELLTYAGKKKIPFLRTGTNGFLFSGSDKPNFNSKISALANKLAATPVRNVWISVDSAIPEIHEEMRGFSGITEGIKKALPFFHRRGLYPSANLGINRNIGGSATRDLQRSDFRSEKSYETALYNAYTKAFDAFYTHVINLGFTIVNACYPMSMEESEDTAYAATSVDSVVSFTTDERKIIYKALFDTIPLFRNRIRIFTPRVSLYSLIRSLEGREHNTYPCLGGVNYHFVDASGNTFPCGYRGAENRGRYPDFAGNREVSLPDCTKCDWECFRDPSELIGPALDLFSSPLKLLKNSLKDPLRLKLWKEDLAYYRKCGFFNGRKPPGFSPAAG